MNYIPGSRSTDDTCNYLHGSISARMAGQWSRVLIDMLWVDDRSRGIGSIMACMHASSMYEIRESEVVRRACRSLQLAYRSIEPTQWICFEHCKMMIEYNSNIGRTGSKKYTSQ